MLAIINRKETNVSLTSSFGRKFNQLITAMPVLIFGSLKKFKVHPSGMKNGKWDHRKPCTNPI